MIRQISRSLGPTEQALWLHDQAHPLHFVLTAQFRGDLDPVGLAQALDHLQARHPLLRVSIHTDLSGSPYFVEGSAPIPLQVLPRLHSQHWQQRVAQELTQPFDWAIAPLIRIVLLQSPGLSDLLMTCHHTIADGLSAVILLRELLTLMNQSPLPPAQPLPSALETLLPVQEPAYPVRVGQTVLARSLLWVKRLFQPARPPFHPLANLQLRVQSGSLPPAMTRALLRQCRQEQTTVHAALCAAFLLALAQQESHLHSLHCFSPVNLRPYLTASLAETCGLYIVPARTTHDLTAGQTFWNIARSLKFQMTGQLTMEKLQSACRQIQALTAARPDPHTLLEIFTDNLNSDLMVTNLGRLDLPQQAGSLSLEAVYGPAVLSGFRQERVVGLATLDDRLFFTIVCSKSAGDDGSDRWPEAAVQILERMLAPCQPEVR
ncbi:hypothetical protein BST81_04110 [Leptolyngbya sp. 'hensonii']|uniref:condensation domain-containing protein n=1 Tax=Leptolyngbya sp. 'hensonii' TaxID=1922337 RepID=UPI00095028B9|nr:condensation domain-containing protein [Leptolyngbya sp. 'hensonii']OLP19728.1 hypothetical protein BST81_04110 [Leptolyngbya sp. 'hensonii']